MLTDHSATAAVRKAMVDGQVRPAPINNTRLLEAMETLPRELFVPDPLKPLAYSDAELTIAPGRTLARPSATARLVAAAPIQATSHVLEVGGGCGYGTAILASLAAQVTMVEADATLADHAVQNLAAAGIDNITVVTAPHAKGAAAQGPYDVIIINGNVPGLGHDLFDQLAVHGVLVAVVGGRARRYHAAGQGQVGDDLFDLNLPPLPGFDEKKGFSF